MPRLAAITFGIALGLLAFLVQLDRRCVPVAPETVPPPSLVENALRADVAMWSGLARAQVDLLASKDTQLVYAERRIADCEAKLAGVLAHADTLRRELMLRVVPSVAPAFPPPQSDALTIPPILDDEDDPRNRIPVPAVPFPVPMRPTRPPTEIAPGGVQEFN